MATSGEQLVSPVHTVGDHQDQDRVGCPVDQDRTEQGPRTSLLAAYRAAVITIVLSDTRGAWSRKQIRDAAVGQGLVPNPANIPLLRVALKEIVRSGRIIRVARGFYRAPTLP
jgi:hypothetical protein